jgi:hypothetical protein
MKKRKQVLKNARDTLADNYLLAGATRFVSSKMTEGGGTLTINGGMIMNKSYNITGNTNAIINIDGLFREVRQSISTAPIDAIKKNELSTLVEQLTAALDRLPDDKKENKEAVADHLKLTMDKIKDRAPNKISLGESIGGMIRTAKDLAEVLPIATKIGTIVAGMFGVPLPSCPVGQSRSPHRFRRVWGSILSTTESAV